jgi:glycosyltransferase 2 family protein
MRVEQVRGVKPRKTTRVLVFAAKALVTIALITWLVRSDSLDLTRLRILVSSPQVLMATALAWLFVPVLLSTARWRVLLSIVGVKVPLLRATALQTSALFFNSLVPGNVGGDLLKNHAVLGNQGGRLLVLVLVERVIGLVALIWSSALGIFLSWDLVTTRTQLGYLAAGLGLMIIGSVLGPAFLLRLLPQTSHAGQTSQVGQTSYRPRTAAENAVSPDSEPVQSSSRPKLSLLKRALMAIVEPLNLMRAAPRQVSVAFALSFLSHLGSIAYFLYLTRQLGNPDATVGQVAMVFPPGMISLVLPISISGLGVGHVMFNQLYSIVGLERGADVFNAYLVGMLAPCVLGAIPYVFMRPKAPVVAPLKAGDG